MISDSMCAGRRLREKEEWQKYASNIYLYCDISLYDISLCDISLSQVLFRTVLEEELMQQFKKTKAIKTGRKKQTVIIYRKYN